MSVHRIPSETAPYFPWSREDIAAAAELWSYRSDSDPCELMSDAAHDYAASLPADYAPSHIMDAADRARMVAECKRLEAVAV